MFSNKSDSARAPATILVGLLLALGACKSSETAKPASTTEPAPAKATASTKSEPKKTEANQAEPKRAELTSQIAETAEVVAIDPPTRSITVRGDDGIMVRIKAGDAVRNYDQIAVGDKLKVVYRDSLTATLRPAGDAATPVQAAAVAGRAEAGAKPGAGVGVMITVRVKIESIDHEHEIVVFSLASGSLLARRVVTDEGRAFVKELKVGDTVQLDYAEALAVSIDKL
jgi:hypothetical protein